MSTKSLDVSGRNKASISNQFQETDDANVHENENHFDWLNEASPNDQIQNDSQTPPIEEWDRLGLDYEQDFTPNVVEKHSFPKQTGLPPDEVPPEIFNQFDPFNEVASDNTMD